MTSPILGSIHTRKTQRRRRSQSRALLGRVGVAVAQFPVAVLQAKDLGDTQGHGHRLVLAVEVNGCVLHTSPETQLAAGARMQYLETPITAGGKRLGAR